MPNTHKHDALANPAELSPIDKTNDDQVVVIIETPKHSRNKYAFDPEERIGWGFRMTSVSSPALSEAMAIRSMFWCSWMSRPSPAVG